LVTQFSFKFDFVQDPDLLLLDEPTNHVDLDTVEWLESYLKTQDVPMVIISHDRAFLDQLCTKIVETEFGVSKTYKGNYSEYILAKAVAAQVQYTAWEKQQKEIEQTKELINRLAAGVNAGRASSEQKVTTWIAHWKLATSHCDRIVFSAAISFHIFPHIFCVTTYFYLISTEIGEA
jgi:ATPase subunit of ABC transporter with duplicated ATPase domains